MSQPIEMNVPFADLTHGFLNVYRLHTSKTAELTPANWLSNLLFNKNIIQNVGEAFWGGRPSDYILKSYALPNGVRASNEASAPRVNFGFWHAITPSSISGEVKQETQRYTTTSCGYIDIPNKKGSYLDYSPYSRVTIFIPYVGNRELDTNMVVGKRIYLFYMVDIVTGDAVAKVYNSTDGYYILQEPCNVAMDYPIASNFDFANIFTKVLGSVPLMGSGFRDLGQPSVNTQYSCNSGILSYTKPFVMIQTPVTMLHPMETQLHGNPSEVDMTLSSVSGYTIARNVKFGATTNMTETEQNMIIESLATGVFL